MQADALDLKDTQIDQLNQQSGPHEQFRLIQQRQFEKISESYNQLGQFNEIKAIGEVNEEPAEQETITSAHNKPKRKAIGYNLGQWRN